MSVYLTNNHIEIIKIAAYKKGNLKICEKKNVLLVLEIPLIPRNQRNIFIHSFIYFIYKAIDAGMFHFIQGKQKV